MYIVTGISRGLGKAIVEQLLDSGETVLGIGRSHDFSHPNFSFLSCDFGNVDEVNNLKIELPEEPITLINNAGIIGNIQRLSDQETSDLQEVMQVNVISPMLLLQNVYSQVSDPSSFTLVNISSGAANRAIPSWANYCASKAALNMLTETFYLEEKEKENHPKVYAVAPGVIDTDMQVQIRAASDIDFSSVENFREMKASNSLYAPELAAKKLLKLLKQPFSGAVFHDLRTIETV